MLELNIIFKRLNLTLFLIFFTAICLGQTYRFKKNDFNTIDFKIEKKKYKISKLKIPQLQNGTYRIIIYQNDLDSTITKLPKYCAYIGGDLGKKDFLNYINGTKSKLGYYESIPFLSRTTNVDNKLALQVIINIDNYTDFKYIYMGNIIGLNYSQLTSENPQYLYTPDSIVVSKINNANSDNIIMNGDFEILSSVPKTIDCLQSCYKVNPVKNSSVNRLNAYGSSNLQFELSSQYNQSVCNEQYQLINNKPYSGNFSAGFIVERFDFSYHQYICFQLIDSLLKEKSYTIRFAYKIEKENYPYTQNLQMYLSNTLPENTSTLSLFNTKSSGQILNTHIEPSDKWQIYEMDFQPSTNANYIVLGKFADNITTPTNSGECAYYLYIDNVVLTEKKK